LMCQLVLEILTNWLHQDSWWRITRSSCTGAVVPAWVRQQSELKSLFHKRELSGHARR
jgi:hypothetical protein